MIYTFRTFPPDLSVGAQRKVCWSQIPVFLRMKLATQVFVQREVVAF